MSLHSKRQGGRQTSDTSSSKDAPDVVGDVILKDKAQFWNVANVHYHQGMPAGENTLNAHCARLLMRVLVKGRKADNCAMLTHDTASVGALVTVGPLVFAEKLKGESESNIQAACRAHLALTHPDETLMKVCDRYVKLLCGLLDGPDEADARALLVAASKGSPGVDLEALVKRNLPDQRGNRSQIVTSDKVC
jgi:hypothetical protein